jgi:hypothetical protein
MVPEPDGNRLMSENQPLKSRKIFAFCLLVLSVYGFVSLVSHLKTPDNIAIQALWVIGLGGLSLIGVQGTIDSIARWRAGDPPKEKS